MNEIELIRRAIELSHEATRHEGGPFGAVVALDGEIIGEGMNGVIPGHDPTAHAEIVAIRNACIKMHTHDLTGAVIFASCEPCPMCLGAIWWARISRIVFGNTRKDAAAIGFDDDAIYDEIARPAAQRIIPIQQLCAEEAHDIFKKWMQTANRVSY